MKSLFFFIAIFVFSAASAHAQQNEGRQLDSQSLYEQASDVQIKEAQKFYRRCLKNETMSKRQDCKCAATEYIAKRIEMGDDALARDIMAANVNTCLRQETFSQNVDGVADFSDVTDNQLAEAQQVFKQCSSDRYYYENYNCECISAKFLDTRLREGPIPDHSTILTRVRDSCPNVLDAVGAEYTRCMDPTVYLDIYDYVPQKDYCECYAREWGRIFESRGRPAGIRTKGAINFSAHTTCNDRTRY